MRKKLFFTYILLIVICISITGLVSLKNAQGNYISITEQRLIDNGIVIRDYILDMSNSTDIGKLIDKYSRQLGVRITIISGDGKVIIDSDAEVSSLVNHSNRPEVKSAYEGKIGKAIRWSSTMQADMMYVAIPVRQGSIRVVRVAMPLTEIDKNIKKQWNSIFIALLISSCIAIFQANWFSVNITKPVLEMSRLSKNIADGDLTARIHTGTNDELGHLANTLNIMSERLESTIGQIKEENMKFDAVLSSMVNGIIAVDESSNIILINPAARQIFNFNDEVIGRYSLEVFQSSEVDNAIHGILHGGASKILEIIINNGTEKILRINVSPINDGEKVMGAVLLIQDITEIRKLGQMRTDFIANVSHELKTPVTSIKGFVETLKYVSIDDADTIQRFLGIIDMETDRLIRLVNDILSLSEIESRKCNMHLERINVTGVILEIYNIMQPYAMEKNISFNYLFSNEEIWIVQNRDRLKQMLINLIDNAIKYTPTGGEIFISANVSDRVVIKVKDTGIGIAREHLPRIFERFYRVDKGRSRNMGGTGLGLAIVKHIAISMGADIEVYSELGKGTEFVLYIPKHDS